MDSLMSSLLKIEGDNRYIVFKKIESFSIKNGTLEINMISGTKHTIPLPKNTNEVSFIQIMSTRVDREY